MVRVELPARCSTRFDSPSGLEFVIPARKSFFAIAFMGFWTIGWACGEWFAIRHLFFGNREADFGNLFLLAWLGGWTVGGAYAIHSWLWMVAGKERIVLKVTTLSVQRDVLGLGRVRDYDLNHISNMRVGSRSYSQSDFGGGGSIAFDYGPKTIRFGEALDEAEAQDIINELNKRHRLGAG